MAVDTKALTGSMLEAGRTLVGDVWRQMETFAAPELEKISVQVAALAAPDAPWSREESTLLFEMQLEAAASVIVAMTSLVLLAVKNAINAIIGAVRDVINGAVGFPLV